MYFPCLVFPYQRVPGLWYTPDSVFTQTIPPLFAGGFCFVASGLGATPSLPVVANVAAPGVAAELLVDAEAVEFVELSFFGVAAPSELFFTVWLAEFESGLG